MKGHRFRPGSLRFLEPKCFDLAETGPKYLTDLYVLRLAISNRGLLSTFDRTIPIQAITGFQPGDMEVLTGDP